MKYDLSSELELKKFKVYSARLQVQQRKVELKEIKKPRSLKAQKYLQVCIKAYAEHFDFTTDEAKTVLKRAAGNLMYEKAGYKFLKSLADLDEEELSGFIDFVREYAEENGLYIETSDEHLSNFW
jgi:hypothetical protein